MNFLEQNVRGPKSSEVSGAYRCFCRMLFKATLSFRPERRSEHKTFGFYTCPSRAADTGCGYSANRILTRRSLELICSTSERRCIPSTYQLIAWSPLPCTFRFGIGAGTFNAVCGLDCGL